MKLRSDPELTLDTVTNSPADNAAKIIAVMSEAGFLR